MDDAASKFAEMALRLHDEPSVAETVDRLLEYALNAVDCDFAGVSFVRRRTRVDTVAATDPLIAELDALQAECGEGPNFDLTSGEVSGLNVRDTAADDRWPQWGEQVATRGIRSMLCLRMSTGTEDVGTLNLYDKEPDAFGVDDMAVGAIMARHAAIALASARNIESLWKAIDARKLVGQAQGILMERFDLDADRAFAVLLRYSQDNNMKLRNVADLLVSTRKLPG